MSKYQLKDYVGAIADNTEAITLSPKYAKAYFERGVCYFTQQKDALAIPDFTKAIEIKPTYAEAFYYRGLSNNYTGKKTECCSDLKKAVDNGYEKASNKFTELCK